MDGWLVRWLVGLDAAGVRLTLIGLNNEMLRECPPLAGLGYHTQDSSKRKTPEYTN